MADQGHSGTPQAERHPLRHGLGFLASGAAAFIVDAAVLALLTSVGGVHPIAARLVAISLAMVTGWLMHRRLTFAVRVPPNVAEFLRYAGVAWVAAAVNYGTFVLIVLERPGIEPLVALVLSSIVAAIFAYLGMRFAAFRHRHGTPRQDEGGGTP
jgi:putative flippase GtrA